MSVPPSSHSSRLSHWVSDTPRYAASAVPSIPGGETRLARSRALEELELCSPTFVNDELVSELSLSETMDERRCLISCLKGRPLSWAKSATPLLVTGVLNIEKAATCVYN